MRRFAYFILLAIFLCGCKGSKEAATIVSQTSESPDYQAPISMIGSVQSLPKAVVYKTNGNYDDNVTVVLNAKGDGLVTFPAPSDVSASSAPVRLGDGWLLDRRGGIGPRTAFLSYTYKEYSQLKETPSTKDLLSSIIPEAKVTEWKVLPITANQAISNPQLAVEALHDTK